MSINQKLAEGLAQQDRRSLSKAITLIESTHPQDREDSLMLLDSIADSTGHSWRLGISGTPGVGKSTFIESFGLKLIQNGHRVCVLTVDPSSRLSGGSILGDKTRMVELSKYTTAYIRSTPSGARLGGVARRTREVILLAEAAGFDVILIETVGVGQSELSVADMTDMFVLLLQPASGDELQGIKRGIMELADMVIVNKADGDLTSLANSSALSYLQSMRLMKAKPKNQTCDWTVPVMTCSSINGSGLEDIEKKVVEYFETLKSKNVLLTHRQMQSEHWFEDEITANIEDLLEQDASLKQQVSLFKEKVNSNELTPVRAANQLVNRVFKCLEN